MVDGSIEGRAAHRGNAWEGSRHGQDGRTMSGLRLTIGAVTVPGPWREACKAIFHVKGVTYVAVASRGPTPALIPASLEDRALTFSYCNEPCGETEFG